MTNPLILRFLRSSNRRENAVEHRQSVDTEYYDEEGQQAVSSGEVICVSDSDVYVLSGDKTRRLIHTHPEGTWIKAEDPASLLAAVIEKLQG